MKKILSANLIVITIFSVITISTEAQAGDVWLKGRVVGVTDGDTITVLDTNNERHEIRLSNIDSPETSCHSKKPSAYDDACIEYGQSFGKTAKKSLSKMVYAKMVQVKLQITGLHKIDKSFNREIGTVYVDGTDINFEQVKNGLAWHYTEYAKRNQSSEDFVKYEEAQKIASQQRSGLWLENNPTAPWNYRHKSIDRNDHE